MSNRHYPYLADDRKMKRVVCDVCHQDGEGHRLEWQVSWFRGDDEIQELCNDHYKKVIKENNEREDRLLEDRARKADRQDAFWQRMKAKLEAVYEVEYLNETQWRINGVVDIYPVNRRFHDIKNNKRGSYQDAHRFLKEFFTEREI